MNPLELIVGPLFKVIDKITPDPQAKAQMQLELLRLQQSGELAQMTGQMEINKVEAASPDLFRGGWRPFIGWICGVGLAYQFLLRPLLGWVASIKGWPAPAPLEMDTLLTLLLGMLGLGAYRTAEKLKNAA
jgi:hypothetical protein